MCCEDPEERHTIQSMLEKVRCQVRHPRDVCNRIMFWRMSRISQWPKSSLWNKEPRLKTLEELSPVHSGRLHLQHGWSIGWEWALGLEAAHFHSREKQRASHGALWIMPFGYKQQSCNIQYNSKIWGFTKLGRRMKEHRKHLIIQTVRSHWKSRRWISLPQQL